MRWRDRGARYGLVSLVLHWLVAAIVLAMLFIGNSISVSGQDMRRLHVTIGMLALPLIVLRIAWRLREGHTAPLPRQKRVGFALGKLTHHVMLAALAVIVISGPITAAFAGLLGSEAWDPDALAASHRIHAGGATVLAWSVLVHLLATLKHSMIDRDGTFEKIMLVDD